MDKNELHNKQSSGYKTPDTYFESFEDRLFDRIDLNDAKRDVMLESETGFETPTHYFDSLEDRILEQVNSKKEETPVISIFSRRNLYYATAVAAVLILTIIAFNSFNSNDVLPNFEDLELSEYEAYIESDAFDMSTEQITALLDDEVSEDLFNDQNLEDTQLLDYLSDEELSDELLYEENL